jgi:hypothetical protein
VGRLATRWYTLSCHLQTGDQSSRCCYSTLMANILLVDISKGFTWDILGDLHSFMYINNYILWDCITDAELTKFRILVNAIHIAISMDWVSGSFWDFVSGPGFGLPTLTRFFYLDLLSESSAWTGCPGSWTFFGIWIFLFFQTVFATLCVWTFSLRTILGCSHQDWVS